MRDKIVHCPNYEICGNTYSFECSFCWHGTCHTCDMLCPGITFTDAIDCPVCMCESVRGVKWPKCVHYTCIDCFKEMWKEVYSPPDSKDIPFDEEYIGITKADYDNLLLDENYALYDQAISDNERLRMYEDLNCDYHEAQYSESWEASKNLRKCPLCRR